MCCCRLEVWRSWLSIVNRRLPGLFDAAGEVGGAFATKQCRLSEALECKTHRQPIREQIRLHDLRRLKKHLYELRPPLLPVELVAPAWSELPGSFGG